jgi:hypothetical protein
MPSGSAEVGLFERLALSRQRSCVNSLMSRRLLCVRHSLAVLPDEVLRNQATTFACGRNEVETNAQKAMLALYFQP